MQGKKWRHNGVVVAAVPMETRRRWSSQTTPVNNAQSSELVSVYYRKGLPRLPSSLSPKAVCTLVSPCAVLRIARGRLRPVGLSLKSAGSMQSQKSVCVRCYAPAGPCMQDALALCSYKKADVPIRHRAEKKNSKNVRRRRRRERKAEKSSKLL